MLTGRDLVEIHDSTLEIRLRPSRSSHDLRVACYISFHLVADTVFELVGISLLCGLRYRNGSCVGIFGRR